MGIAQKFFDKLSSKKCTDRMKKSKLGGLFAISNTPGFPFDAERRK
jgi:hypothetical protein